MRSRREIRQDYQLTKSIEELQKDGSIVLTGTDVKNAEAVARSNQVSDAAGEYAVALEMNKDGAAKFAEATKKALESKESIGIYYDDGFVSGSECQQCRSKTDVRRSAERWTTRRGKCAGNDDPKRSAESGTGRTPFQCGRSTARDRMQSRPA